jgi:phosphate ABC transporter phosphate-binding protein
MKSKRILPVLMVGLVLAGVSGCSSKPRLTGGGSSFVDPMMQAWAAEYRKQKSIDVDYTSSGSGDGIKQMIADKNMFGCTDAPMSSENIKDAGGEDAVIHVPLVMGAVVPIYNLKDVKQLRFTGAVLSDIYLGKITKWNDPELVKLNPKAGLTDMKIAVVHRADGSGTSHIFTDFLSTVSKDWKASTNPKWRVGQGAPKNPGVAKAVASTEGAIGYVELIYALQNKGLNIGLVANAEGEYVEPSLESVTAAAAASLKKIPDDLRFSIVNPKGKGVYPISGTVWCVCKVDQPKNGKLLADFLRWCLHDGQDLAKEKHYARLPTGLVELANKKIDRIK